MTEPPRDTKTPAFWGTLWVSAFVGAESHGFEP